MGKGEKLHVGGTFLLRAGKEYFLSTIESVTDRSIEATVPSKDYPPTGMKVSMDFHDDDGCTIYKTDVIRGPSAKRQSVRLKRPGASQRITHREYTRIDAELPVRFREMGTVSYHDGRVVNISAGGILLRTEHAHEFQKLLEIELKLPGSPRLTVLGQIVHKAEQMNGRRERVSVYGCKFVRLDRPHRRAIVQYVRSEFIGEPSVP